MDYINKSKFAIKNNPNIKARFMRKQLTIDEKKIINTGIPF
jgi:hypothetical protein